MSAPSAALAPSAAQPKTSNLKWWILLTVIVGTFLGRLDQTIVNLALPKIITDFNISVSASGWIATASNLANAVFVPLWGKLGDTIGRKKVYILGFVIFILGSVLAGLAWDLKSMIIFRVIQAIAGSADYPTAMAILAVTFKEGKERAQALGLWSSSFAAAAVFGPLIGGPLIDNFGWRSVFLVNLPVGIIGLVMALIFIKESVADNRTHFFDWWGAISLGVSLSSLVLILDQGLSWGWLSGKAWACYIVTILTAAIFVRIENRVLEPIVDLKFFKNSVFVNTLLNNFIVFMGMMGSVFLIPIFTQRFLGYDATHSGYLFMPMAAAMMLAAPIGGALTGKVQPRFVIAASTLVAALGIFSFSFTLDIRSTALDIMWPMGLMAFGMGFGMSQRTNVIAAAVPTEEIGAASSVLALARNIAGSFGIAVFSTLLTNSTNRFALYYSHFSTINTSNVADYKTFVGLIILKAYVAAYHYVFQISALVVIAGAITALWIKVKHERNDVEIMIE